MIASAARTDPGVLLGTGIFLLALLGLLFLIIVGISGSQAAGEEMFPAADFRDPADGEDDPAITAVAERLADEADAFLRARGGQS